MNNEKITPSQDQTTNSTSTIKSDKSGTITWSFLEFEKHKREKGWYIWFGIVVISLLIYAFWTFNLLFAFIIITASLTILVRHSREPKSLTIIISDDGVKIGNKMYAYKVIKNFWLIYNPKETQMLYISFKNITNPTIGVPLEKQNPILIREFLLRYIEEDLTKENELTRDALSRIFKL